MSNQDSTTSILNITSSNIRGKCDLKCAYNFDYPNTTLVARNAGTAIELTCEPANTPPVTYNTEKYNVFFCFIISPSSHEYNGAQVAGEFAILHTPVNGGNDLVVYIPLFQSTNSNTGTTLITEIITGVAASAPTSGETTNINLSNFTLQDIVPSSSFYSYSLDEDNNISNCIVFGLNNGIPLTQETLSTLTSVIEPYPITIPNTELYFNKDGPNQSGSNIGEGIYISCNPTGSSESTTTVATNQTTNNIASILNNPVFTQVFVGCFLFIVIFAVLSLIFNMLAGKPIQMPSYFTKGKSSSPNTATNSS
jgi:hypothetical protein